MNEEKPDGTKWKSRNLQTNEEEEMTTTLEHGGRAIFVAVLLAGVAGCVADAPETGEHRITIYGEEFVEDEIPASETDGWRVDFERFEVAVLSVEVRPENGEPVFLDGPYRQDLTEDSSGTGHELARADVAEGPVGDLDYRIAPESGEAAVIVEGTAMNEGTEKSFAWSFETVTSYTNCETTAEIEEGEVATSELTIHADHLFYDSLVDSEPDVRFGPIAEADADDDGDVTLAELTEVDIGGRERYGTGNVYADDLRAFLTAQTRTLGHIDGEGHCDTNLDL
jgi:hypothetical protein